MHWILWALLSALFLALYHVFIKLSSGNIQAILGAVILQAVAVLAGLLGLFMMKLNGVRLNFSASGIRYAVLAGIAVGLAEIFSFYALSQNVAVSKAVPAIVGGSVLLAVLIGLLVLREQVLPSHLLGMVLVIAGILLLAR